MMEQWQFTAHTNKLPPMRQSLPYEPLICEPPSHTVQKYKRQSLPPVDATRRPVPPPPRTPYIAKKIKQRYVSVEYMYSFSCLSCDNNLSYLFPIILGERRMQLW